MPPEIPYSTGGPEADIHVQIAVVLGAIVMCHCLYLAVSAFLRNWRQAHVKTE